MSVAYEPRPFHDDSPYAPVGENDHDVDHDDDHSELNKYINTEANVDDMADLAAAAYDSAAGPPSPFNTSDSPALDLGPVGPPNVDPANVPITDTPSPLPVLLSEDVADDVDGVTVHATNASRSKPIAKPDRIVTKNVDGLYECRWPGCKEDVKAFQRKCEWSKHMDKHERPYVCTVRGCEKVQGFTYSGGLLRHEREVHGKHGGPRNALNCPHASCKRNKGKGFSRLENLQEHLRRVHRDASPTASSTDNASDVATAAFAVLNGVPSPAAETSLKKRKRVGSVEDVREETTQLREENERLRAEKDELARQLQEQTRLVGDMRAQLESLQVAITQTLQEPRGPVQMDMS